MDKNKEYKKYIDDDTRYFLRNVYFCNSKRQNEIILNKNNKIHNNIHTFNKKQKQKLKQEKIQFVLLFMPHNLPL